MKKLLISTYLFLASFGIANAQITNPLKANSLPELIGIIIQGLLGLVGSLSLIMFIYGGILWLTSGGNPDSVKKGRQTIVYAIMGLVLIFSAYAILKFVFKILS